MAASLRLPPLGPARPTKTHPLSLKKVDREVLEPPEYENIFQIVAVEEFDARAIFATSLSSGAALGETLRCHILAGGEVARFHDPACPHLHPEDVEDRPRCRSIRFRHSGPAGECRPIARMTGIDPFWATVGARRA